MSSHQRTFTVVPGDNDNEIKRRLERLERIQRMQRAHYEWCDQRNLFIAVVAGIFTWPTCELIINTLFR